MPPYLAAMLTYFALVVAVALIAHRRSSTAEDFLVGGRTLNPWVTALSAQASDMSSWLFLAYPGLIYLTGLSGIWVALGLWVGMWGAWRFVAPKLRTETERLGANTLTTYLSKRFGGGALPIVAGIASLIFFSVYVASGFVGIGILFETLLGADRLIGIGLAVIVVAAYTAVGGFYSICWLDFWQAIFLFLVIVAVPIIAYVDLPEGISFTFKRAEINVFEGFMLMLGWGLGYYGQGHILAKFMGIDHAKNLKRSMRIGLSWQAICLVAATIVGLLAQVYFVQPLGNSELSFIKMATSLFPTFIAGLVLCAILAATISTIDSQVIVLVSILSEDFYHRFVRRSASEREVVVTSRVATVFVCVAAFGIAALQKGTLMSLVMYAWSGLGSAFGPLVLLSLHSKIKSPWSAVAGIVVGTVVSAAWPWIDPRIPAMIPGFGLSLLSILATERLTAPAKSRG